MRALSGHPSIHMPPLTPSQRRDLLKGFYGELQMWDFVRDIYDDRTSKSPMVHRPVPDSFESFQDYVSIFLPLLLEETKAQLHRSKEQELTTSEQFKTDDFQIAEESTGESRWTLTRILPLISGQSYYRGELVVISERPLSRDNFADPGLAHLLGVVDEVSQTTVAVNVRVSLRPRDASETATVRRFEERSRAVAERIAAGASWYLARLTSIATVSREYLGLMRLEHSRLADVVISGTDTREFEKFPVPWRLADALKHSYNQYQLEAIEAARKEEGVTLILGPPGTGKSHTILGVVATILARLEQPELSKADLARPKSIAAALAQSKDSEGDMSVVSDSEGEDGRAEERVAWMRSHALRYSHIGQYRPWEDLYPLKLSGGDKDARTIYSTLSHSVVGVRKLHNFDKEELEDEHTAGQEGGKVLVCAPSNAAIDELVRRMVRVGILGKDGELYIPRVTRLGPNIHPDLVEYSFGRQVEQRAARFGGEVRRIKNAILREAEIIAATLSVSGSLDLAEWQIDTVVVDEAGQGVELSTLIPLQLNCKRLILVGDHKQLPATVFSLQAQEKHYARSLFQRLISQTEERQSHVHAKMLKIQFRMHPEISRFPSLVFYDGELEDAQNIMQLVGRPEWHESDVGTGLNLGPVAFYDVRDSAEEMVHQSLTNPMEAEVVVKLILTMMKLFPTHNWKDKIAVISPYAEQVKLIRTLLKTALSAGAVCPIEVNTVDGFQGREKDIIIVSTVRAKDNASQSGTQSIGFLRDARRMNVMFTRARQSLWIVGNWSTLLHDPLWSDFLGYVSDERKVVVDANTFVHAPLVAPAAIATADEAEPPIADGDARPAAGAEDDQ